jgi:hypothetical protein
VNCEEEWGFGLWGSTSSEAAKEWGFRIWQICRFGGLPESPDSTVCRLPVCVLGVWDLRCEEEKKLKNWSMVRRRLENSRNKARVRPFVNRDLVGLPRTEMRRHYELN